MIAAIIFGILFGIGEAVKDFGRLDAIVHGWRFWLNRTARFGVCMAFAILIAMGHTDEPFTVAWAILPILAAACIVVPVHRYTLNRLRKLDGSYISTSNGYDRFWLRWFGQVRVYGRTIPGEIAYITEITAAVALIITHYA